MDFRIIKKFCLKKAYKLFLHPKQSYQTKPEKNETSGYEIVNLKRLRVNENCLSAGVEQINHSFSNSRFLLATRT